MTLHKMIKSLSSTLLLGLLAMAIFPQTDPVTEAKITALMKKMTLQEKVNMLHASSSFTSAGVKRLGIPELVTADGPHGVHVEHGRGWDVVNNVEDGGIYVPTGNTLAATRNPQLGYAFGISRELRLRASVQKI